MSLFSDKSTEFGTARMLHSVTEKLDGSTNYRTWALDMQMLLEVNEYWGLIDGTEPRPKEATAPGPEEEETVKQRTLWDKKNRKVLALLILSVKPAEKEYIRDCVTASDAWEKLGKMYSGKRTHRLLAKLKELTNLNLELKGGNMPEYLRVSKQTVSELSVLGLKLDELAKKAFILNGLPEKYDMLVMTLESQIATIDLEDVSARLLEEAEKLGDRNNGDQALSARFGKRGPPGGPGGYKGPPCEHCGGSNHSISKCYDVHGYPPDYKGERRSGRSEKAGSATEWLF